MEAIEGKKVYMCVKEREREREREMTKLILVIMRKTCVFLSV